MNVLIVEPGKNPIPAEIENTLEAKQKIVGGLIEMVTPVQHHDDAVLICNEEGKINGLEPNRLLCFEDGNPYDVICGKFFICRAPSDSEDFAGLTENQMKTYSAMYSL